MSSFEGFPGGGITSGPYASIGPSSHEDLFVIDLPHRVTPSTNRYSDIIVMKVTCRSEAQQ